MEEIAIAPVTEEGVTQDQIIEVLKTIEDPELFLDIWFLGLIYTINIGEDGRQVSIDMTFTSPMCPAGPLLIDQIKRKVLDLQGVEEVEVKVVFTPPWQPSEDVKLTLGLS